MGASFQPLVGVVRVHPEGGYGDPYSWACTVVIQDAEASLYGATRAPTRAEYRAVRATLEALGVRSASWERRKEDRAYTVRFEKHERES